jgi:hypothetical protein
MQVQLRPLRALGKKIADRDFLSMPTVDGELALTKISAYKKAEVVTVTSGGLTMPLATLWEPEVIQISRDVLILRGIEKVEDRGYLQEWSCKISAA